MLPRACQMDAIYRNKRRITIKFYFYKKSNLPGFGVMTKMQMREREYFTLLLYSYQGASITTMKTRFTLIFRFCKQKTGKRGKRLLSTHSGCSGQEKREPKRGTI
jgi:phage regulator Rha-like protein